MTSITDFHLECSDSACIGILAGLHFDIKKIIDDFVKTGKADASCDHNHNYPLKRAIYILSRLLLVESKITKIEYDYLMQYRELLYFENPPVKTNEDKEFLELLKKYTEFLNDARKKVSVKK